MGIWRAWILFCWLTRSQPLRADGYAFGAGQHPSEDEASSAQAWKPAYEESAAGWRGHLVTPYGCVRPQAVFLPRAEWDLILQEGDTVLDLHIPRKDPLTAETCGDSYRQALEFFPRVFPERPWKALYCHTWFFTPQLQSFLPPESSIVKFQREFYLYPFPGSVGFLWSFVFGEKYPDPATAPRDTSLRRAVLDWIGQGKEIFDLPGVMFHDPEAWGSQPYMKQWDQWIIFMMQVVGHPYNLLKDFEVTAIHKGALRILAEMGMEIQNEKLLAACKSAGYTVELHATTRAFHRCGCGALHRRG